MNYKSCSDFRADMARHQLRIHDVAMLTDVPYYMLGPKLRGDLPMSEDEESRIRRAIDKLARADEAQRRKATPAKLAKTGTR